MFKRLFAPPVIRGARQVHLPRHLVGSERRSLQKSQADHAAAFLFGCALRRQPVGRLAQHALQRLPTLDGPTGHRPAGRCQRVMAQKIGGGQR